ncbi:unnamed protein product [Brassica rapa subsp. trilocularis]
MAGEDGSCPRSSWKTRRRVLFRRRSLPKDELCRRHAVGVHIPASTMTLLSRLTVKPHAIDNLCYWSGHELVVKARLSVRVSPGLWLRRGFCFRLRWAFIRFAPQGEEMLDRDCHSKF